MQQGNKNCLSTFQRLMNVTFLEIMGVFVHCYQDDIFVFSNMLEEHETHLKHVFNRLRESKLFLSSNLKKIDVYSMWMDCLGFIIDNKGIHIDPSKIDRILEWRMPRSYHNVQKFNGVIQYIAQFLLNVADFTLPLTGMCSNNQDFIWTEFQDDCFCRIKELVSRAPVCKPINSKNEEPIWVITDVSATGIGAWYSQGPSWDSCRPAGFISRKFTPAQMNYCTWEQELLGVLEALLRWEDKLLGLAFTVVTNHQALTFFNKVPARSQRRMRWWEYLARFDFKMQYLKGEKNKVADALSRYFTSNRLDEKHDVSVYINMDSRLDPSGEDLTIARTAKLTSFKVDIMLSDDRQEKIQDHVKDRMKEAEQLSDNREEMLTPPDIDPMSETARKISKSIPKAYKKDRFFSTIWKSSECFQKFMKNKGLLWTTDRAGNKIVCVPDRLLDGKSIRGTVIESCHQTVGHASLNCTVKYIRHWFWWPTLADDIEAFCKSCGRCQSIKTPRQKTPGWLHTLPLPTRPWESIGMDFTGPCVEVGGFNYILLVICRMTGMVHLIPTRMDATAKQIVALYVKEVVRLHGIPESIVSDRDAKFTSLFWSGLSKMLGQRLLMSMAYHPQTDSSSERAIQAMSQVLRLVVNDCQTNWVKQLPLVEFAMNSTNSKSMGFAPFEANYRWMLRIIRGISFDTPRLGVKQFIQDITNVLDKTFDRLLVQRTHQAVKANKHRREGQSFKEGYLVLLSTTNLNMPKGRTRKLCPKYIGPYKVIKADPRSSVYKLELSPDLQAQRIHDTFHEKLLKPYVANDDDKFPKRETWVPYDIGDDPEQEWVIEAIEDHKLSPRLLFKVRWALGDKTWEPLHVVNELEVLDQYLELEGVPKPTDLRRK